ncbi:MAG: hypothetical protein QXW97_03080 [Candidatus Pacearchaeota archaeon]
MRGKKDFIFLGLIILIFLSVFIISAENSLVTGISPKIKITINPNSTKNQTNPNAHYLINFTSNDSYQENDQEYEEDYNDIESDEEEQNNELSDNNLLDNNLNDEDSSNTFSEQINKNNQNNKINLNKNNNLNLENSNTDSLKFNENRNEFNKIIKIKNKTLDKTEIKFSIKKFDIVWIIEIFSMSLLFCSYVALIYYKKLFLNIK